MIRSLSGIAVSRCQTRIGSCPATSASAAQTSRSRLEPGKITTTVLIETPAQALRSDIPTTAAVQGDQNGGSPEPPPAQLVFVSPIDHCCICSKSAAEPRLLVEMSPGLVGSPTAHRSRGYNVT